MDTESHPIVNGDWIYVHKSELEQLKNTELKSQNATDLLNKLKTEFAEFQDRAKRDNDNTKKFALDGFLRELIPILDTLDSAITPIKDEKIKFGLELVRKELLKLLGNSGFLQVNASNGTKFDPKIHEAVEIVSDRNYEPDTIICEIKKGYIYNERVLRPAVVKVSSR